MEASTSASLPSISSASFGQRARSWSATWRQVSTAAFLSGWSKAWRMAAATTVCCPLGTWASAFLIQ